MGNGKWEIKKRIEKKGCLVLGDKGEMDGWMNGWMDDSPETNG